MQKMLSDDTRLQPKEVVGYLNARGIQISLSTVRSWIAIGRRECGEGGRTIKLKSIQIGRGSRRLVSEKDLLDFLNRAMGVNSLFGGD